jgi:hypothetical protein
MKPYKVVGQDFSCNTDVGQSRADSAGLAGAFWWTAAYSELSGSIRRTAESPKALVITRLYPASQMMMCMARTTVAAMARDCTACLRISR